MTDTGSTEVQVALLTARINELTDDRREIVAEYGRGDADTGSTEVQVALLTARINELTSTCASTARTTTRAAGC